MNTKSKAAIIRETPGVKGKYVKEIVQELMSKPSEKAKQRNKQAQELVKKLQGIIR